MKKIIAMVCIALFIMILPVSATTVDEVGLFNEAKSDAVATAVNDFNEIRRNLSLPDMTVSEVLKEMAQVHSKYMAYNKTLTSIEESDDNFFRGRYPWDRSNYFKYDKDYIYEFVKKGIVNYQNGMDELLDDPVTRYFMLDPMYSDIGMAVEEDYFTFDIGGDRLGTGLYVNYPYSTQESIPARWRGDSFEELYRGISLNYDKVGMPVTVTYYGDDFRDFTDIRASILNVDTNQWIPIEILQSGEHYLLTNTLTLLPLEPYDFDTTYQVSLTMDRITKNGEIKDRDFNKIYHFSTESLWNGAAEINSPYITRGGFTEKLVRSFGYELIETLEPKFTDVSLSSYTGRHIYTAYNLGLINGFSESKFRPELNITKEQAYVIFVRAYENQDLNESGEGEKKTIEITNPNRLSIYYDDQTISGWAYEYVLKASELGIVTDSLGYLNPGNYLTEEDFYRMLDRYYGNL